MFFSKLWRFLLANLSVYALTRLFFWYWHSVQFSQFNANEIIRLWMQGLRFDLVIVGALTGLVALFFIFLPLKIARLLSYLLMLIHGLLLPLNVLDIELISFTGRRFTTSLLFLLKEDNFNTVTAYAGLSIFGLVLLALYITLNIYFILRLRFENKKWSIKVISAVVTVLIALILSRGGFQEKPISFVDANIISKPMAHQLALNTTFTFLKSIGREHLNREPILNDETYLKLFRNQGSQSNITWSKPQYKNVVVILLESFSREYISPKTTPFFMELMQKGFYFENSIANARRSVEGITAVLSGVPALMDDPILSSEFANNDFVSLGKELKSRQYTTAFFHGAKNGSMRFDAFTFAAGFDLYFGKNEFNKRWGNHHFDDGTWGIFDEPFLDYACEQTTQFKTPFITAIFTLSSHVPFKVPEEYLKTLVNTEAETLSPLLKSVHYTDWSLRTFFKCVQNKSWFKDTLFVLVADHTGPALDENATFQSRYEIPILFYAHDMTPFKGIDRKMLFQQIDILPTVLDLLSLHHRPENLLAKSAFLKGERSAVLYSDHQYEVVGDNKNQPEYLPTVKSYYSQGLYQNRLFFDKKADK